MRPLILTISAFGPFSTSQHVDFTALGEQPLFLINGVTGAGKTTLLDAICFALYGKTTGDEREAAQMRCDHARDELLTSVEFSFALQGRKYWIKRLPEQYRPKAKGDGFTKQSAEAQLWTLDAEGELDQVLVSQKVTDANREIENITGLNVDQFRQVMILPQGQFRRLLLADSKDREAIFSQLFSTHIYKRIEFQLRDQALTLKRDAGKAQDLIQGLLDALGHQTQAELVQAIAQLQTSTDQALVLKQQDEKALQAAQQLLEQGKATQAAFGQLSKLEHERSELKAQQAQIAAVKLQVLRAEQAQEISATYTQHSVTRQRLPQLQQALAKAGEACSEAERVFEAAKHSQGEVPELRRQMDACKAKQIEYRGFADNAHQLNQAQATYQKQYLDYDTVLKQCTKLEADRRRLSQQQLQIKDDIERNKTQLDRYQGLELKLKEHEHATQALSAIVALHADIALQAEQLEALKIAGMSAAKAQQAAKHDSDALELKWHQSHVYRLASQLEQHQPCPVCGGTEHPAPAKEQGVQVTQEQVEHAKLIVEKATNALNAQREIYSGTKSQLNTSRQQWQQLVEAYIAMHPALMPFNMDQAQAASEAAYGELIKSQQALQALQAKDLADGQQLHKIEGLLVETEQMAQSATTLQNEMDKAVSLAAAHRDRIATLLPAAFQVPGALDDAVKSSKAQYSALETQVSHVTERYNQAQSDLSAALAKVAAVKDELERLQAQAQVLQEEWLKALANSFFKTELEYLQAVVESDVLLSLRQQLEAFEQQWKFVEGAIASQRSVLAEQAPADIDALGEALAEKRVQRNSSDQQWSLFHQQLQNALTTQQKINTVASKNAALEAQYQVVGTLSDVANGQTGDKLSLQRFVLSALLDDVLIDASSRLQTMSKGRYQLLRKESRAKGNKASGLELEVDDAYTGKRRAVATLSGGESFMAALALALGLSSVVQAYAGGIELDTLFIDEGFGSLDAESLELAVRTLVDLQRSGRTIGVISHVTELKEQMPLRIDITSGREGSQLHVIGHSSV